MKFYTMYASLLTIVLLTSFYVVIVVVCDSGFIDFIKNKHTLLTVSGARKTQEWLDIFGRHDDIVNEYFMRRKTWVTSNLGAYLFKNIDDKTMLKLKMPDRFFKVVIWRYWDWLKRRHGKKFNDTWNMNVCSVDNCRFSGDRDLDVADAVVVHIQNGRVPKMKNRNSSQIWIMLSDESPQNTFSLAKKRPNLQDFADIFNWTMTYRSDSDIPVPYGRTLPLHYPKLVDISIDEVKDLVPFWTQKQEDVLAAILISNCKVPFRRKYLKELNKHIDIDIYGKCATDEKFNQSCPGYWKKDCPDMSNYLFYLAFENSKCRQYITEKIYQHAFDKGAIPVILGPPVEDCKSLLPPNSFLHVDDFKTPKELALQMVSISNDRERILSYHAWRNNFKVVGEHGYFDKDSYHLCRICEALNYNDVAPKVYNLDDIQLFLDSRILCS